MIGIVWLLFDWLDEEPSSPKFLWVFPVTRALMSLLRSRALSNAVFFYPRLLLLRELERFGFAEGGLLFPMVKPVLVVSAALSLLTPIDGAVEPPPVRLVML